MAAKKSPTKRKQRRNPEETKASIDDAALQLFADKGYSGTATSEIAKQAGIAEGTIFRHYKNKKALLLGVMGPLVKNVIAPIATKSIRRLLQDDFDSVEDLLQALASDRIDFAKNVPSVVKVLFQEAPLHVEVRDLVADVFAQQVVPDFRVQLTRLQDKGAMADDVDVDTAIRMIISVFAGYILIAHLFEDGRAFDDDKEAQMMVRVLARGLSPSPPP